MHFSIDALSPQWYGQLCTVVVRCIKEWKYYFSNDGVFQFIYASFESTNGSTGVVQLRRL